MTNQERIERIAANCVKANLVSPYSVSEIVDFAEDHGIANAVQAIEAWARDSVYGGAPDVCGDDDAYMERAMVWADRVAAFLRTAAAFAPVGA